MTSFTKKQVPSTANTPSLGSVVSADRIPRRGSPPRPPMAVGSQLHVGLRAPLTVMSASDSSERQADALAHKIMRSADSARDDSAAGVKPAAAAQTRPGSAHGTCLSEQTRGFFEPRFGYDFSRVRVHTDPQAAASSKALHARAFTLGSDIVFGPGQYTPETREGKRLLAHELAHVVQQSSLTATAARGLTPVASPTIQRELIATGDAAGFAALVNSVVTTQLRLTVDSAGRVSLAGTDVQGPPTREAQALTATLRRIMSDSHTTTIAFVHGASSSDAGDRAVMIGSYELARIDLDDLAVLGSGEGISGASALAHELTEQHRRQVFSEAYPVAHAGGMAEEAAVTGATRGASTRVDTGPGAYEIEVAYHYPDHTVFVTRVVQNQNIVAVRRRITRP